MLSPGCATLIAVKKLINAREDVLAESLAGLALAHPELRVDHANRVVYRAEPKPHGTVGILSGGGSGHEPLHAGYVGFGMLDAAVCGEIFTSPTPDQILAATEAIDSGAGVLQLVKNYTGDVLNFEMAAELAGAIAIDTVVLADDVAVEDSTFTAGRRGTGVTVLVEKLVGAAAEQGRDLAELAGLARRVAGGGRSMGMALTSATLPASGRPNFDIGDDEMEIGVGIHGEPGRRRTSLAPAREVAEMLLQPILAEANLKDAPAIVMLNGMGATPLIELYLMFGEVAALLEKAGVRVARSLVGNYITSLDMAGCSVTVLRADDEILGLWDAPVSTPALRWGL
jgi:phosphoenolpyruvate---glycerone phosphotransferase subunit DhaK